jgi:hypothetical protein
MLFPVKVRVALVGLVVAGGAVASVALGPAGPAVGQSSPPSSPPIQVQVAVTSPATLVAGSGGTEVDVSVTATCSGPDVESAYVGVTLTEAVDGDIANGFGSTTVDCTGTSQTSDVSVVAFASSPVGTPSIVPYQDFTKGPAIAQAQIDGCDSTYGCFFGAASQVIKIHA